MRRKGCSGEPPRAGRWPDKAWRTGGSSSGQEGARKKGSAGRGTSMCEAPGLRPPGMGVPPALGRLSGNLTCCLCVWSRACSVTHTPASHRFLLGTAPGSGEWPRQAGQSPAPGGRSWGWRAGPLAEMLQAPWELPFDRGRFSRARAVGAQARVCFVPSSAHLLGAGP